MNANLRSRLEDALDTVRPHLAVDGGNVEIVDITDDMTLRIRWQGACVACSMSPMTMRAGIEYAVKQQVPEILSVEAIA
ncbi:MAG: hypothetical protein RI894_791 [Bacteroidota bacterium]|jgi:Fe-S cluster biogenesis protein NfuA